LKKPKVGEPAQAPESFVAPYRALGLDEPLARYYGAVTCMDATIGELLAQIERQGKAENTLVVFMSDNGGSGNGGNPPLHAGKSTMWEGGLRSPLLVWWPKQLPANRVTDEFLTSLEWFPTLARIAGVEPEAGVILDGFDMWPVLRGEQPSPRREMFWEWASREMRACRIGNWKWVESNKGGGLFDLSTDLAEVHDQSHEQPATLAMVKERLPPGSERWMHPSGAGRSEQSKAASPTRRYRRWSNLANADSATRLADRCQFCRNPSIDRNTSIGTSSSYFQQQQQIVRPACRRGLTPIAGEDEGGPVVGR